MSFILGRPGHLSGRVGLKNKTQNFFLQPDLTIRLNLLARARLVTWSGWVGFGSNCIKFDFLCIKFRSGRVLGQKIWLVPSPCINQVGSGWIFSNGSGSSWSRIIFGITTGSQSTQRSLLNTPVRSLNCRCSVNLLSWTLWAHWPQH